MNWSKSDGMEGWNTHQCSDAVQCTQSYQLCSADVARPTAATSPPGTASPSHPAPGHPLLISQSAGTEQGRSRVILGVWINVDRGFQILAWRPDVALGELLGVQPLATNPSWCSHDRANWISFMACALKVDFIQFILFYFNVIENLDFIQNFIAARTDA